MPAALIGARYAVVQHDRCNRMAGMSKVALIGQSLLYLCTIFAGLIRRFPNRCYRFATDKHAP